MTNRKEKILKVLEVFRNREVNRRYDENGEILTLTIDQSFDQAVSQIEAMFMTEEKPLSKDFIKEQINQIELVIKVIDKNLQNLILESQKLQSELKELVYEIQ